MLGENKIVFQPLADFVEVIETNHFGFNQIFNSYLLTKYSLNYPSNSLAHQHHLIEHTVEAIGSASEEYESVGQCIGYYRSFDPLKYPTL